MPAPRRSPLRLVTMFLAALAIAAAPLIGTAPAAHASAPCDYDNKVYCDGGDEPGWQWDTIDDFACVQIPGAYLDADDKPVYTGVVGKVYYKDVLVWDSTPAPAPTKPKPKPKPAAPKPAASAPASNPSSKPKPSPSATPTPTPTATPEPSEPASEVIGQLDVSGELRPGGELTVTGTGFAGTADGLTVELHSTPVVLLATVTTDAAGGFVVDATIPDGVAAGEHRLVVLVDGVEVASLPVTISSDSGEQLGSFILLGALVAAGAAALLYSVLRRRRATSAVAATDAPASGG